MPFDRNLDLRGRLMRSLGALREMLPGSLVERQRKCGKPNCRCADGKQLHSEFQISVLIEGQRKTFHVPAELAEEAHLGRSVLARRSWQKLTRKDDIRSELKRIRQTVSPTCIGTIRQCFLLRWSWYGRLFLD